MRVSSDTSGVRPLRLNGPNLAAAQSSLFAGRTEARSKDGTLVPVSLVYGKAALRNGKLNGSAPLLVEAYGGFGASTDPSYNDVIAAVERLIAYRYTSEGRVALMGISSGAIIPGLAMLQRPELFGIVLFEVGQPDEIRGGALDPTAARNLAELGDLDTPEGVLLLRNASPYHRVPERITLPAVVVHSSLDDYNFGTEMLAGKYVARLQKANSGHRPVI